MEYLVYYSRYVLGSGLRMCCIIGKCDLGLCDSDAGVMNENALDPKTDINEQGDDGGRYEKGDYSPANGNTTGADAHCGTYSWGANERREAANKCV